MTATEHIGVVPSAEGRSPAATRTSVSASRALLFFPSLTDVAFLMPLAMILARPKGFSSLLGDGDTLWHIRTGEWMLSSGSVPRTDFFSFTKAGETWFAWEWLWDLAFGWLHGQWGLGPVVAVSALMICATAVLVYRLALRKCGHPVIAIGAAYLALTASSLHWLARPHLATLLLSVLFLSILERANDGRTRLLAWLPFLTVLWVNLHGGFFVGIFLVATYAAGMILSALVGAHDDLRAAVAGTKPYWLSAAACVVASFCNPYTYRLHLHIYGYLTDTYQAQHMQEMLPLNFGAVPWAPFAALYFLGAAAALWYLAQNRLVEAILLLGWAALGITRVRNVPLFGLIAAPFIAEAASRFVHRLEGLEVRNWLRSFGRTVREIGEEAGGFERVPRVPVLSLAAIIAIFLATCSPSSAAGVLKPVLREPQFPIRAVEVLRGLEPPRLFHDDEWGDYLNYALYPAGRVFIDGRSDFYGRDLMETMGNTLDARYDWERNLSRHSIDTVLARAGWPLASVLKQSRNWQLVYDDGTALIFRRASAEMRSGTVRSELPAVSQPRREGPAGRDLAAGVTQ